MNRTVLVTGAPGWLGTALVKRLLQGGARVRCFVEPRVDPSPLPPECQVVRGDIRDAAAVARAMEGVSDIFHLAAVIHPRWTRDFDRINAGGTRHVLEAAVAASARRVVLASSNAAQGSLTGGVMNEAGPCRPRSAYGRSKRRVELLAKEYADRVQVVTVRSPMFYGPGQPARMTRLMQMIRKSRFPVFGDGQNLRSMTYVDNLVDAMMLVAESSKSAGETYWISDARPYTTIEFLSSVAEALETPLRIVRLPAFVARCCEFADNILERGGFHSETIHVVGESTQWIGCSIDKAREQLGYAPSVALGEGLRRAVAWCRERRLL